MQTHQQTTTHPAGSAAEQAKRVQYAQAWDVPQRRHGNNVFLVPAVLLVLLVLLMGLAAIAFAATAPGTPDRRAEWDRAEQLRVEQQAAIAAERRQRAAQAMCASDHGPNVLAIWVSDTTVECVNARGRRLSRQSEGLHASSR